jgi:hypothetical protein
VKDLNLAGSLGVGEGTKGNEESRKIKSSELQAGEVEVVMT